MSTVDDATRTMISNFPERTGRSLDDWVALIRASGRTRHGEVMTMLRTEYGMSHGFANLAAITALKGDDAPEGDELVDAMYAGPKSALRPLHDAVVSTARSLGEDVELAPKKAYVSLRRRKQFGMVGPGPAGTLEIGFNLPGEDPSERFQAVTGMCTHRVRIASEAEFNDELVGWLRRAYEGA
ncbi:MAG TPA: DUF4287 domain-containing protein [Candidatus Limnocylindrales bacterium]|nr:DUF4287 domain-containing protein [Candidatus Limnocylindrales bacterium]